MVKKLTKHGNSLALIIDKALLETLGINEKTNLEILVIGDTLVIKPRSSSKTNKKRQSELESSANRIMDKYESVLKKLAKT